MSAVARDDRGRRALETWSVRDRFPEIPAVVGVGNLVSALLRHL